MLKSNIPEPRSTIFTITNSQINNQQSQPQPNVPLDLSKAAFNMRNDAIAKVVAALYDALGDVGFDVGAATTGVPKSSYENCLSALYYVEQNESPITLDKVQWKKKKFLEKVLKKAQAELTLLAKASLVGDKPNMDQISSQHLPNDT